MKRILPFLVILLIAVPGTLSSRENSTELYEKGVAMARDGRFDEAIEVFRKVVSVSPWYSLGHYGLGRSYLHKEGMQDDAIRHLKRAVALERDFARGHFYLGMAYFLSEKYVYALHAFREAYKYEETLIEALYNMGAIYDMMGKSYESIIYFRKYKEEKEREEEDIIF